MWNQPNLLAITALQANLEDQGQALVQSMFSWGFIQHANLQNMQLHFTATLTVIWFN